MQLATDGAGGPAPSLGSGPAFFDGLAHQFGISPRTLYVVGGLVAAVALSGTAFAPLVYGLLVAAIIYQVEAWIQ